MDSFFGDAHKEASLRRIADSLNKIEKHLARERSRPIDEPDLTVEPPEFDIEENKRIGVWDLIKRWFK